MARESLRPGWVIWCAARAVASSPVCLAPLLAATAMMGMITFSLPVSQRGVLLVLLGALLGFAASVVTISLMARAYWKLAGHPAVSLGSVLGGVRSSIKALFLAGAWSLLLIAGGAAALMVGIFPALAFSLWVLCATILEGEQGRATVDRAWQLCGPSGILFSLLALAAGGLLMAFVYAVGLGPTTIFLAAPMLFLIAVPVTVSAYLQRLAA